MQEVEWSPLVGFGVLMTPERLITPLQWRKNGSHTSSFGVSLEACLQAAQKMPSFQGALACGCHSVTLYMLSLPPPAGSFVLEKVSLDGTKEKKHKKRKEKKTHITTATPTNHPPKLVSWMLSLGCRFAQREREKKRTKYNPLRRKEDGSFFWC